MVEGRVVYEMMESAWPAAATDDSLPGFLQEFGRTGPRRQGARLAHENERRPQHSRRWRRQCDRTACRDTSRHRRRHRCWRRHARHGTAAGGAARRAAAVRAPRRVRRGRPLFDELSEPLLCDLLDTADFREWGDDAAIRCAGRRCLSSARMSSGCLTISSPRVPPAQVCPRRPKRRQAESAAATGERAEHPSAPHQSRDLFSYRAEQRARPAVVVSSPIAAAAGTVAAVATNTAGC